MLSFLLHLRSSSLDGTISLPPGPLCVTSTFFKALEPFRRHSNNDGVRSLQKHSFRLESCWSESKDMHKSSSSFSSSILKMSVALKSSTFNLGPMISSKSCRDLEEMLVRDTSSSVKSFNEAKHCIP